MTEIYDKVKKILDKHCFLKEEIDCVRVIQLKNKGGYIQDICWFCKHNQYLALEIEKELA